MTALYNEIDPFAAQWLRNLIAAGHIAPGVVDTRSIEDISPDELKQYTQVHFFAGVGVWSYALRRAGWPDSRPVWTGSCPCQPFSAAGKGGGFTDERHLWPAMHYLIEQCRPAVVFGEQVASADGLQWLDLVQTDLENTRYAVEAFDLCAAGVGAPHIRQRLYWMAHANGEQHKNGDQRPAKNHCAGGDGTPTEFARFGAIGDLAHASNEGSQGGISWGADSQREDLNRHAGRHSTACGLGNSGSIGHQRAEDVAGSDGTRMDSPRGEQIESCEASSHFYDETRTPGPLNGFWRSADWLTCRDGKWRAVEPGTFPLADRASGQVGRLRAYGNALVAPVAEIFIRAYLEAANDDQYNIAGNG